MTGCPTPWKMLFGSRAQARRAIRNFDAPAQGQRYAYRCPCGGWHLTSMSRRDHKAVTRRKRAA